MDVISNALIGVSLVNLLLAFVVFRSRSNIYFSLYILGIALWSLGLGYYYRSTDYLGMLTWMKVYYSAGDIISYWWLLFSLTFPKNKKIPTKTILTLSVAPYLLIFLICFTPQFFFKEIIVTGAHKNVFMNPAGYFLYSIYFLGYYIWGIRNVWKNFKRSSGIYKMQLLYVLVGNIIAFGAGVVFDLLLPWANNYQLIWIGPLFSILNVSLMFYASAKHRLFGVKFFFGRAIHILILSLVPLGAFYAAYFLYMTIFGTIFRVEVYLLGLMIAILFTYLFNYSDSHIKWIIYRLIINQGMDFAEAKELLSKEISSELNLQRIFHIFITIVNATVLSKGAGIVIFEEGTHNVKYMYVKGLKTTDHFEQCFLITDFWHKTKTHEAFIQEEVQMNDKSSRQAFDNYPILKLRNIIECMARENIEAFLPLSKSRHYNGFVFLGRKKNDMAYSVEDINFLKSIINSVSVGIERSLLYDQVEQFNITLQKKVESATGELKQAYEKLHKSFEDLKTLDHMKDEFLSITSHDLRTPLTIVRSYLWLILNTKKDSITDPKAVEYLDICLTSTNRLIRLVNNTLTVSRIEAGHIEIKPDKNDIEPVIEDVVNEFQTMAQEKNITFTFEKPSKQLPTTMFDKDRIREVLVNLVGNAMHYTTKGGITIKSEQKDQFIVVSVTDTGKGIEPENISKMFKKFGRLESALDTYTPDATGTGLGLYISKSIVELHKGKIWVESEAGKGSTFSFSLPISS
jgi:signal transduction histidine kinase